MKPLKVVVVGGGHLGRIHARLLHDLPGAELLGVVDPDPQARAAVQAACPVPTFAELDHLLPRLDAAVVASPTCTHAAVAQRLLAHGVHLLVEKPLAATAREAQTLAELAQARGLVLAVGHVERFNPAVEAAGPFLRSARWIQAVRVGPFTGRSTDTGAVLDLMIHDLDLVLAHAPGRLVQVQAWGQAVLGRREDVAHALLWFDSGTVVQLTAARVAPQPRRVMHVWSDGGYCELDFAARCCRTIQPSETLRQRPLLVEELPPAECKQAASHLYQRYLVRHEQAEPECNQLAEELADFLAAVREGRRPRTSGAEAAYAVAVAEQIVEHLRPQLAFPAAVPEGEPETEPAILPLDAARTARRREAG